MNKDLTVGNPGSVLWRFCLPLFGSVLFQQFYNIADSLIAGKCIGEAALAAVGNSYEITLVFLAFAFGLNIGCSVVVSRLFGAKRFADLKTAVSGALITVGALCAVLMALGLVFGAPLLRLIHTPEDILADSKLYLDIYLYGLPFLFFYNVSTGIFSALGDSKTPFLFLAFSSTANILMDLLFVQTFRMGVAGVAWATFLCQGVSCTLAVVCVLRRLRALPADHQPALFSLSLLRDVAAIAIPSILQQSFVSVGNILIQGIINPFGSGVIAGYAASIKLNNLVITSFSTIANGISNYTAQNLGAGKAARVREGTRAGRRLVWLLCVPLSLLYFLGAPLLVRLFLNAPTADALRTGVLFLRIVSPFYFVISVKLAVDGTLRGAGRMKPFMISTFTDLILRVVLAAVLSRPFGSMGIWLAWPIGWCVATAMSVAFARNQSWNRS